MHAKRARNKRPTPAWLVPVLLCLIAFGLRLGPLWVNRFHPDEALYASWALAIAYGRDTLLAQVAPDKPPLPFYLTAVAFFVLGRVEVAARLIGLMAGTISVALMWRLALILRAPFSQNGEKAETGAIIAAAAMALSPFAILFSPTAFLDPLMVVFVLASLVAMSHRQPGWAGVWLGLATATKVEALIFLPLVLACGAINLPAQNLSYHQDETVDLGARFLVGLVLLLGAVLAWDRLRGGTPFWAQQAINYGGIRPIYASEVTPRLVGWASFLPYFFGWPMLIALVIGLPFLLLYDLTRNACTPSAVLDLMLIAFALGYFFLHWLLAFPLWDRYMLGLIPVLCLLAGRMASLVVDGMTLFCHSELRHLHVRLRRAQRTAGAAQASGEESRSGMKESLRRLAAQGDGNHTLMSLGITVLVIASLIPSALQASRSALPLGGDHGTQDGIDQVTDYVRSFPYGTVVYDHWLGWSLRYYLWDARTYVAYFASPEALAEDLRVFGRTSQRFIVFPASESTTRVIRAIAAEGFVLSPVLSTRDRHGQPTFTLYHIQGR